jgi:uncharacterized protein
MDRVVRCASCGARPVDPKWRPFCSRRCQIADQARWADESYRVPGPPVREPDAETDDQDDG